MALVRWEPFRDFESMQPFREFEGLRRDMDRIFDNLIRTGERGSRSGIAFVPAAEMQETPEAIHLKLEVPGMEAQDLDVQVTAEAIAISGERKSETKAEEGGMTRSEFRYGSFNRIIPLPTRIKNDQVQAEFKNGVLNLTLPKAEEEKNKVIKVNLG